MGGDLLYISELKCKKHHQFKEGIQNRAFI